MTTLLLMAGCGLFNGSDEDPPPSPPIAPIDTGTPVVDTGTPPPPPPPPPQSTAGPNHCGPVAPGEVWADDMVHVLTCHVQVEGTTLTITPGTQILATSGTSLAIAEGGATSGLMAIGTPAAPIHFTADPGTRGAWDGIRIYDDGDDGELAFENVTISYAGAGGRAALYLEDARPLSRGLEIASSAGPGIAFVNGARLADGSVAPVVRGSALVASIDADGAIDAPDLSTSDGLNDFDWVRLDETVLSESVTLPDPGLPYVLEQELQVEGDKVPAIVTIEAGVTLLFGPGVGATFSNGGGPSGLSVQGTQAEPVLFSGTEGTAAQSWYGVFLDEGTEIGGMSLEHLTIEGAVNTGLLVDTGSVYMDTLTLADNGGYGFSFWSASFADGSRRLVSTRNLQPGFIWGNHVPTLPLDGLDLSGNHDPDLEEALWMNGATIETDATWPALGIPYGVGTWGDVYVESGTLTLEPGVEIILRSEGAISASWFSSTPSDLVFVGTAANPIVIRGEDPTPGSWDGVYVNGNLPITGSRFEHVRIVGGGGYVLGGNLHINGGNPTISDVELTDSEKYGLYIEGGAHPQINNVTFSNNALGDIN